MDKTQQTLVIIKPDGLVKSLTGNILTALSETKLKIVGAKILKVPKKLAEIHYQELKRNKAQSFPRSGQIHNGRIPYRPGFSSGLSRKS